MCFVYTTHSFARAAIIKYYKLGRIGNRNKFTVCSGHWKSESKLSGGLVHFEGCEKYLFHAFCLASVHLLAIAYVPCLRETSALSLALPSHGILHVCHLYV